MSNAPHRRRQPGLRRPASIGFAEALGSVALVVSLNDRLDETEPPRRLPGPGQPPVRVLERRARCPAASSRSSSRASSPSTTPRACSTCWWPGARPRGRRAPSPPPSPPPPEARRGPGRPGPEPERRLALRARRLGGPARRRARHRGVRGEVERGAAGRPVAGPGEHRARGRRRQALAAGTAALIGSLPPPPSGLELQLYPHFATARRPRREQRLAARVARPHHPHHLGRRRLHRPAPLRRDGARERRPGRGRPWPRQARGCPPTATPACTRTRWPCPSAWAAPGCGVIGDDVGRQRLRAAAARGRPGARAPACRSSCRRSPATRPLAFAQGSDVIDRDRRPLVPVTTLTAYQENPKAGTEQQPRRPLGLAGARVREPGWAMSIDLSRVQRLRQVRDRLPGGEQHPGGRAPGRSSTAARCPGCASTATTTRRRRRARWGDEVVGRAPRGGGGAGHPVRAHALPALRERALRDGVPLQRHHAQRGRPQPADLQPLRRHPLLRQQLPVQGAALQLVRVLHAPDERAVHAAASRARAPRRRSTPAGACR